MSKFLDCPVENESPDPCPKCGATVSGNDPVNGVCQAGATWDRAEVAERERCAKIADTEAAEFQCRIDEHNKHLGAYVRADDIPAFVREEGVYLHAKRDASQNLAGLIRLTPEAYEMALNIHNQTEPRDG